MIQRDKKTHAYHITFQNNAFAAFHTRSPKQQSIKSICAKHQQIHVQDQGDPCSAVTDPLSSAPAPLSHA